MNTDERGGDEERSDGLSACSSYGTIYLVYMARTCFISFGVAHVEATLVSIKTHVISHSW